MTRVAITLNNNNITILDRAKKRALELTAEALLSDIKLNTVTSSNIGMSGEPESTGFVDNGQMDKFVASIVFDTPYAKRLYWHPEYNSSTDTDKNREAQGMWMQAYIDGDKKDFAKDTYIKFFRQLTGGIVT